MFGTVLGTICGYLAGTKLPPMSFTNWGSISDWVQIIATIVLAVVAARLAQDRDAKKIATELSKDQKVMASRMSQILESLNDVIFSLNFMPQETLNAVHVARDNLSKLRGDFHRCADLSHPLMHPLLYSRIENLLELIEKHAESGIAYEKIPDQPPIWDEDQEDEESDFRKLYVEKTRVIFDVNSTTTTSLNIFSYNEYVYKNFKDIECSIEDLKKLKVPYPLIRENITRKNIFDLISKYAGQNNNS